MNYRQFWLWVWLWTMLGAVPALAQPSVDQVIEKYVQAIGGQAAYEKITTRTMKGTAEIPDDNVTGPAQVFAKAPGSYRLTIDIPGYGVIETVVDGDHGWEKNPDSGVNSMSNADLANAKRDHHFYREVRLKELFPKMEMAAAARVNGRAANVIEATPAGGTAEKLYFDAESGLLVKHDYERVTLEDGIVQYEVLYGDYRDVDGLKLPATIEQRSPDSTTIFKFAEIRNNAPLADTAFAKPEK
jgi:outer membrane lipoprotein-sorting protein